MKSKITENNEQELKKILADKREELSVFRFGGSGTKVKNVKAGRMLRKGIARILTKLRVIMTEK